jgi:hypothetical protein
VVVSKAHRDPAVLNSPTISFFDFHSKLQVEVASFVAAIDDVVVASRLAAYFQKGTLLPS